LRVGEGRLIVSILDKDESGAERSKDTMLSERLACEACERSFPDLSPQSFSFNSPQGMCAACNGLGHRLEFDPQLIVPNPEKSVLDGAIKVWSQRTGDSNSFTLKILEGFAQAHGIDLKKPWSELADEDREHILRGSRKKFSVGLDGRRFKGEYQTAFEGIIPMLERRFQQTQSEGMRQFYAGFMSDKPCDGCQGLRLREESRHVLVAGHSLTKLCEYSVREVSELFERLMDKIDSEQRSIGAELVKEVRARLRFLTNVGLDYLSLNRKGPTLSGGESQRIQLASQLGSELSGVIYVLDEPSIGLHTRDARKLIDTLQNLRDLGNSVLVVEHDRDTIEAADWLIDFGPGAGTLGGQVTAAGTPAELADDPNSLTGLYLSHRRRIEGPAQRRVPKTGHKLTLRGARANNLRNVDVEVPLSLFVCVTGVSGAGKSTLINQVLLPAATRKLHGAQVIPGEHDSLDGLEKLDKVIAIDQQPIGRTPRSNPATYVKVWDEIRSFFAELNESKAFGFGPGRFSFNVKGGRCEGCQGSGVKKVEMHFLPDVFVICQECNGKRFNDATLRVRYQGRNIAEILDLTVDEAAQVFDRHPNIKRLLTTLQEVGLGYISLGQQSPSLSGGEAQRVKLARELSRKQTGRTFYVLDEPSTGLHFEDIKKLLSVLQRLVESGNSVLVIEHNLDIIKTADWLIDVGPEGGSGGGKIVATGTPELVAHCKESYTGQVLAELFEAEAKIEAPVSKVKGSKIKASQAKTTQAKASQAETSNGKPSKSKTANSKKKPAPSKSRKVPSKT
jgi:excinuclease ABC subunit A